MSIHEVDVIDPSKVDQVTLKPLIKTKAGPQGFGFSLLTAIVSTIRKAHGALSDSLDYFVMFVPYLL